MPTMREIGKRLYFRNPSTNTVSSASKVGATASTGSYVRYGTAQADSAEGKVQVKLDNSEDVVACSCDSPIKQGDRVKVIVTESGALIAMPIGQNIVDYVDQVEVDLAQQIIDKGTEILDEVNGEMEEWKQDHQLTDADIQHQISTSVSGATETWEGQLDSFENNVTTNYALKTELTTGINGLRSEISETYATSEGVENEINTAISQASGQIQSTVEQNVMNAVGDTYATKTELTQTSDALTININSAASTAEDAKDAAEQAQTDVQEVSSYFRYTSSGLEVGREGDSSSVKMNTSGAFQTLYNGTVVSSFSNNQIQLGQNSSGSRISFCGGTGYIDSGSSYNVSGAISSNGMSLHSSGGILFANGGSTSLTSSDQWFALDANGEVEFYVSELNINVPKVYGSGRLYGPLNDFVTNYGVSSGVRYWEWAGGRREACGSISVSMSAGGSAGGHQISLPFSFTDQYSYRVLVTLNTSASSPPNGYNNVGCLAYNKRSSSFYVTAWNSSSFSMSVDLNWYAIGVGN